MDLQLTNSIQFDKRRLDEDGYTEVEGAATADIFLALAHSLGTPASSPTGELIKQIRPTLIEEARPNTFSANFGKGSFPYHTDTAFWPTPARYVLLRACAGDLRRPTHLMPFAKLFSMLTEEERRYVPQSIWITDTGANSVYNKMILKANDRPGYRYDPNCMRPANTKAQHVDYALRKIAHRLIEPHVTWKKDKVLIIDNWKLLHARGTEPENEGERILERIYVHTS